MVDDASADITSITVGSEFRTDDGDGDTTTMFVTHKGGVTPTWEGRLFILSAGGATA